MTKAKLTLFHNGCEWVVAASPADATCVWAEAIGEKPESYDADDSPWEPWGEDRSLSIMRETRDGEERVTLTGAEWAANGRAYIGSTEF